MIFQKTFHVQGHRGARGLLPENTIESCCRAVECGVAGLEIDIVVSKDGQIVVSHEPWMSASMCSFPDGNAVNTEGVLLKNLTIAEIQQYDCGGRGNPRFPTQDKIKCYKPTLYELVLAVHTFCESKQLTRPFWNIEVKSHPKWYGRLVPPPPIFVRLLKKDLDNLGLLRDLSSFYISSFDLHILREMKKITPSVHLAFLTENRLSFEKNMRNLGFLPTFYSPYYKFLTTKTIEKAHKKGVKVVTWTVNDVKKADMLKRWQLDGLITDFPNLLSSF
ncbi:MAG: hypothetical protein JNL70_00330 [Saprospiraceae bacterium]|nr:hypothetical protein [Saprospiraceae bacterium]